MRTIATATASTTAMMAMISSMVGSVSMKCRREISTAEGDQALQVPVAQPEPTPQHQAEIEPEQRMGEQRTADPQVRGHRAAEIAGQQDRTQDRGRRDCVEHSAGH